MVSLFSGSLIPTPTSHQDVMRVLCDERRDLVSAINTVLADLDAVIPLEMTRKDLEQCVDIVARPACGDPDLLREECAVLLNAAISVMEDPTVRLTDPRHLDRLREVIEHTH